MRLLLICSNTIIIFITLLSAQPSRAQIPDLIHYWKLDETDGGIFQDSEGNLDMTCIIPNCPAPITGQVSGAQNFDGVDDMITTDPALIPNQTNGITVMAWVNPDDIDSTDNGVVHKNGCFLFELEYNTGFIDWTVIVGLEANELQPVGETPFHTWTHFAGTYDGIELKVYKNGNLAESQMAIHPGPIDNPLTPYQIGYSKYGGNDRYFDGGIDEVAIFNRALNESEIQWAYENGLNGLPLLITQNNILTNSFQLYPNFPNPFNPSTTLRFEIPASVKRQTAVELIIFNSQGQHIKTLYRGSILPGTHEVNWNGDSDSGQPVASGMYYAVLKMGKLIRTRKLLLVK